MRIENGNIGTVAGNSSAGAVRSIGNDDGSASEAQDAFSDTVSLSNASGLIDLAKHSASPDRQSRLSALATQVDSGVYPFSAPDVAHAILRQSAGGSR